MISIWQLQLVHTRLHNTRWRIVNREYGWVEVQDNKLRVTARDGTKLEADLCYAKDKVAVTVWGRNDELRLWLIVEHDLSSVTDIHTGLGSVTDLVEVLCWAQHNVCYLDDEGYIADTYAVGGRELVLEREEGNEVRN